ncbi:MAG: acyl-CoA thioesterase II [Flavobacteriaceae bacterium TMED204]|jgi:acyl-CoA thioesterase-2|nr:acyl-CoA thioesterase II [Flavobacteriaceae bacterium]MBL6692398.1 acyl-CoA thioesterase II [Flavobacteriaceae bacterium]MCH1608360.1 acyl-CoA thioesterase II [Flavobacteriaceae bacterium]MDG1968581.1 acyl-CoA thioesterase II [Flavobacteriaceae bacterium]OUW73573.1 MAG: acyl-CoA thioesterase II [Flavobacteriaceae bacterium TMED204]|tara:strand:- start:417 stop:1277 length:861 start_codon:yes stop_codon:yes gene_type:complete
MKYIQELIDLITLEKKSKNTFEGQNFQTSWGRVFGGQVLAQALHAAYQTVPKDRFAHSLHGYFILGGNLDLPITYEVDIIRDGKSFTTRRVVAFQEGRAIFNMSASFQLVQSGVDHQFSMPNYIPPEKLLSDLEQLEVQNTDPEAYNRFKKIKPEVIEFRPVEKLTLRDDVDAPAESNYWFRSKESTPFGLDLQHQLLAYISDYGLLRTATLPHKKELGQGPTFYTSIDHAIWFHRPFSLEEWLLYAMDSPSASSSRGFSRGTIFDREGLLVASTAQEGLIRQLSQ